MKTGALEQAGKVPSPNWPRLNSHHMVAVNIAVCEMDIVMPQSSLVGSAFPKLQFGISPPENSTYDRGCLDEGP
jgi:hypothetical protein